MVTSLYAGLLGAIYFTLTFIIIQKRRKERISLGDNNDPIMNARIRAHANFVETVPLALILLFLAEHQGASLLLIHALSVMLLIGRIMHPIGILKNKYNAGKFRLYGMILTLISLLGSFITCLYFGLLGLI